MTVNGSTIGTWRGAYVANLNSTAAAWEAGTQPYEAWLSNSAQAPVQITQALGYCDTGSWSFAGAAAFPIMSVWRQLLAARPNLVLRLAIPMVMSETEWDSQLLSGARDSVFQSINDYIVNHHNDVPGGCAQLIRLRIGWEGNGDWYAWGHRPSANGYTGSTYSTVKWRQGWRRIAGLFAGCRALGTKLVYNPALPFKIVSWGTQWPGLADDGVTNVPAFEALVDVLGGDAYDQWLGGPGLTGAQRWANMYSASNGILSLLNFATAKNKPVSFDEWGVDLRLSDASNPTKPSGDDANYITQISVVMQSLIDADKFDGAVYWETNNNIQSKLSTSLISPNSQATFKTIWGGPDQPVGAVRRVLIGRPKRRAPLSLFIGAGGGAAAGAGRSLNNIVGSIAGSGVAAAVTTAVSTKSGVGASLGAGAASAAPLAIAGSTIVQVTVTNTTATPTPAETYVTFGQPFKQGDVPNGSRLRIEKTDGTILRSQADLRATWPADSSLRWCEVSCVAPSIPANGSLVLNIKAESGAFDNTQRRLISDIVSTTDLKFNLSNLRTFGAGRYVLSTDIVNNTLRLKQAFIDTGASSSNWESGMAVRFGTTGGGLTAGVTYYISTSASLNSVIKVHATQADAVAGTNPIDITADISGTTIQKLPVAIGSGNWSCRFNTAQLVGAKVDLMKSGPVCDQWRVWGFFTDDVGGALHPHLNANFYVTTWTKSDGTLGPISHISSVHQGWLSIPNLTMYFYDAVYRDGATTIRDFKDERTVTAINTSTDTFTVPGHNWRNMFQVELKSTGSYPGGKVIPTANYFIHVVDANNVTLHTDTTSANAGSGKVDIADIGTGTVTLAKSIFHNNRSSWWSCAADALPDWTANDPNVFVKHDKTYLLKSGLLPPYDLTTGWAPATDTNPQVYSPQYCGTQRPFVNGTGGSEHIGLNPQWAVRAFLSQEETFARTARANALDITMLSVQFRNEATGRICTFRGSAVLGASGDYPGLGTNRRLSWYFDNPSANHSADMALPSGGPGGANVSDPSHYPNPIYYPLLTEGGAHLMDANLLHANYALAWRAADTVDSGFTAYRRNEQYPGKSPHYGVIIHYGSNVRQDAWAMNVVSGAAALCPDSWAEQVYFRDIIRDNAHYAVDVINGEFQAFRDFGHWQFNAGDWGPLWMNNFVFHSICCVYKIHQHPDLLTWINHMKIIPKGFCEGNTACIQSVGTYKFTAKHGVAADGSDFINDWSYMGGVYAACNVAPSTDIVTRSVANSGEAAWPLTNGDKIKFMMVNPGGSLAPIPAPLLPDRWYYVRDVSGANFKVSDTLGGPAIDITGTGSGQAVAWWPVACQVPWVENIPDGYLPIALAAMKAAAAVGVNDLGTAIANLQAVNTANFSAANGSSIYSWPGFAFASSYPA